MTQQAKWMTFGAVLLLFVAGLGAKTVEAFAETYEKQIAEQVAMMKTKRQQAQIEMRARLAYTIKIQQEQQALVRSGRLSTPKVEELRAQRQALEQQMIALDKAIEEASWEAPEIKELQAIEKSNEERIDTLQAQLNPAQKTAPETSETTDK